MHSLGLPGHRQLRKSHGVRGVQEGAPDPVLLRALARRVDLKLARRRVVPRRRLDAARVGPVAELRGRSEETLTASPQGRKGGT